MPKLERQVGTTGLIVLVNVLDTASTNGGGKTGLTNASAGLSCYYKRNTGTASVAASAINSITTFGTYNGSSTAAAFKEVDPTNMAGCYEFHAPNNALASGADSVVIYLLGAAGMAPVKIEIELTATSNQDAAAGGITRLDATVSSRSSYAGGDTSGTTTLLSRLTGTRATNLDNLDAAISSRSTFNAGVTSVTVGTNSDKTGYSLTQAFPSNFASMALTVGGAMTVGTNGDKTGYALTQAFPANFATLSIDGSGRVTYAPGEMAVKRNTALGNFAFLLVASTDHVTPKTGLGAGVTPQRSIDGGAFAACANAVAELANGIYVINLANTDLNGAIITLLFTGSGADPRYITIVTQP